MVGRLSGSTRWIQHGTVPAGWSNTRTDGAAACNWPVVAGPDCPVFLVNFEFHHQPPCQSESLPSSWKGLREADRFGHIAKYTSGFKHMVAFSSSVSMVEKPNSRAIQSVLYTGTRHQGYIVFYVLISTKKKRRHVSRKIDIFCSSKPMFASCV